MDYLIVADKCILDIHKLDKPHRDAYENAIIYKERTKACHDKKIARIELNVGDPILLFNSRLCLFPGKLHSRWLGPFGVTKVMQSGAIEIQNQSSGPFIVNGQRLKHYNSGSTPIYYYCQNWTEPPLVAPTT